MTSDKNRTVRRSFLVASLLVFLAALPLCAGPLKRARITIHPVYSTVVKSGQPRAIIGVIAEVKLKNLKMDVATERGRCEAPCSIDSCSESACFYDPVYPVYDPQAPEKSWHGRYAMQLMINTSYFKVCRDGNYHKIRCANSSGLLIRNGEKLLGEEEPDDQGNLLDAIVFWKDGRADLFRSKDIPKDLRGAELALGGNWFFEGNVYRCDACHSPDRRAPRTALGLDRHGRVLTIVVVQPGTVERNASFTARELHALMKRMGVHRGFMLDGGGSSQFVYVREGSVPPLTLPPGDREGYRPVPGAFGILGVK